MGYNIEFRVLHIYNNTQRATVCKLIFHAAPATLFIIINFSSLICAEHVIRTTPGRAVNNNIAAHAEGVKKEVENAFNARAGRFPGMER